MKLTLESYAAIKIALAMATLNDSLQGKDTSRFQSAREELNSAMLDQVTERARDAELMTQPLSCFLRKQAG